MKKVKEEDKQRVGLGLCNTDTLGGVTNSESIKYKRKREKKEIAN